jgi:hypothetical protein
VELYNPKMSKRTPLNPAENAKGAQNGTGSDSRGDKSLTAGLADQVAALSLGGSVSAASIDPTAPLQ